MRTRTLFQVLSSMPMLAIGCAGSHTDQVRDARIERIDEQADVQAQQIDDRHDVNEKNIERQADSRAAKVSDMDTPSADASERSIEVDKEHALYKSEAQARLDKLAVRIDAARQKLTVLGTHAPAALHTELGTAVQEHAVLTRDLARIDSTPAAEWKPVTERMDDRIATLSDRVKELARSIEDI